MAVEVVFTIGRGTALSGGIRIRGAEGRKWRWTRAGGSSREVEVSGVEMFRTVVDTAQIGDNVGLLLRHVDRSDVVAGDVLSG